MFVLLPSSLLSSLLVVFITLHANEMAKQDIVLSASVCVSVCCVFARAVTERLLMTN